MVVYILSPEKIDSIENHLPDFIVDDLIIAIKSSKTKIASSFDRFISLQNEFPKYYKYQVQVGRAL
jgi:hypothetical protein